MILQLLTFSNCQCNWIEVNTKYISVALRTTQNRRAGSMERTRTKEEQKNKWQRTGHAKPVICQFWFYKWKAYEFLSPFLYCQAIFVIATIFVLTISFLIGHTKLHGHIALNNHQIGET
jgi:hypothetical protein